MAIALRDLLADFSHAEVMEWVGTRSSWINVSDYRRGDTSQYETLLRAIHPSLLERTRDYAYRIAFGSGREPLTDDARARIESEFSGDPVVIPPPPLPPEDDVTLGVIIDVSRFFER